MLAYTTVGTNDLPRAVAFYDSLFAVLGAKRAFEGERGVGWGVGPKQPTFAVMKPFDGQAATAGNGTMLTLACSSVEQVQALHAKALALGAADEGQPGPRGPGFYLAYFRDLDGNKLAAFTLTPGGAGAA